jgi:hypothetical protein
VLKLVPETAPVFATLAEARDFLQAKYQIKSAGFSQADVDAILPRIYRQDASAFPCPKAALEFLEEMERLNAAGFSVDELNWLLAADPSAKVAPKETDAARFLTALRKDEQGNRAAYDPAQYDYLAVATDVDALTGLLTTLLQRLNRDDTAVTDFLRILRGRVQLETIALLTGFVFPPAITAAAPLGKSIPIQYNTGTFRFTGLMTDVQRTTLLTDTSLSAAVRGDTVYQSAIEELYQQSLAAASNFVSIEATSAGNVTLPADRPSLPLRYNTATQALSFIGVMTVAEQAALNTPANAAAQPAIAELFQHPRLAIKFFEPVFTAPLARQPLEVDFTSQLPEEVAAKITYDPEQRLLRFNGIMSGTEKTALLGLSGDVAYVVAVNQLALSPSAIPATDDRVWLTDVDLDATQPATDTYAKRLANAALKALNHLSATSAENIVVQQASAQLGLTESVTRHLLTAYAVVPISLIPPPPAPPKQTLLAHLTDDFAIDPVTRAGWFWANRVAAIVKKWKITLTEMEQLDDLKAGAQLLDFSTLALDGAGASLDRFLRINRLLKIRDRLPETDITLLDVLEKLNAGTYAAAAAVSNPAVSEQHLFAADVEDLNDTWLAPEVEALTGLLDLVYPTDYLLAESWERLSRAFDFLATLNASASTTAAFAAAAMTDAQAKSVNQLLRSKFGAETWLALSAEIQDALRERKRDALAAYLLNQPKPTDAPSDKWENANDLYAYYLLDVEMSSCLLTSRLVQAAGSVQLFVQRCFMALEPHVVVVADGNGGDSAWRWWKWMSKYQVWVANRKVFLWPENWIEPELKKDRSPFLRDLENELQQNDINQDTVETAFSNYLEKLDGVAQLEIAGVFQEDNGDNTVVHVFGRNSGAEPHLYYYRRYDYRQWSPWEKIDLDIQGDYLIPGAVNNRLFLFWPVFTEVPEETGNSRVKVPSLSQYSFTPDKTVKRLRLQLAFSEYRQGKWTPKKVSNDFDESANYNVEIVRKNYTFLFIDDSILPGGRVRIQYDGYGIASNTKAALETAANGALADKQSASQDKTTADGVLSQANLAFADIQIAAALAKDLVQKANDLFAANQSSTATAGGTENFATAYRDQAANVLAYWVQPAYAALVPGAADPADDASLGIADFEDALSSLKDAFETVRLKASQGNNAATLQPLIASAQTAAHTADDAATEALRIVTSFKDSAADDARSSSKAYRKASAVNAEAQKAYTDFTPDDTHRAILRGAFEISGCTGVPEKVDAVGAFTAAVYPEPTAVGADAA